MSDNSVSPASPIKPKLRGVLHLVGAFVALPFCVSLSMVTREELTWAVIVYSASLLALLSTSALYHVPQWSPKKRAFLRRLDHAMIFVLIGGSYVPFLAALGERSSVAYVYLIAIGTGVGVARSLFVRRSQSKVLRVLSYGSLGVVGAVLLPNVYQHLGFKPMALILGGGVIYLLGATAYALKKPNFAPRIFEYHELFHLCVNIAAALHFAAIWGVTVS